MEPVLAYRYRPAACLEVSDEDAPEFLQSQFSADLRPFEAGLCAYGLWLDARGRVIADSHVLCESGGRFRLISEESPSALIREHLGRHIVADEVLIESAGEPAALALFGQRAADPLKAAGLEIPAAGRFARSGRDALRLYRGRRSRRPAFELVFDSVAARETWLAEIPSGQTLEFVSENRVHLERIDAGFPRVPAEIGPGESPGEGGLVEAAVSLAKGCFLGQEVVARMHNVGRIRRGLFVVSGGGNAPAVPGVLRESGGRTAGELRSAAARSGGWLGVALLKKRVAEQGTTLDGGDFEAVVEGPFAPPSRSRSVDPDTDSQS